MRDRGKMWTFADGTLAEFYSMADSSITVTGIPIRIAGGCWAQCPLHTGIRYVSVTSKLRISLASVKRWHRYYPGGILLDGWFLSNGRTDSNSDWGRWLDSTPATQWYMVRPYAIKTHEVVVFCGGTTRVEFYSMADSSTTVTGIRILIAGGCWARRQLHASIG